MIKKELDYPIISLKDQKKEIKTIPLKINEAKGMYIIHRTLIHQLQDKREKKANTKTRSEVRGGGKKPWKQKGTGKARAGSSRSPLWRGGGVIFGPKTRICQHKINKKEKQLALRTLLYNKRNTTLIINDFNQEIEKPNTKDTIKKFNKIGINIDTNKKILIIVAHKNKNFYLSIRNLSNVDLIKADQLNIIALLKADALIITNDALDKIHEVYNA